MPTQLRAFLTNIQIKWSDVQLVTYFFFFVIGATAPSGPGPPHSRFLDHTQRRTTVDRTPLDEWSARQRPLPDNTQHSQQTDIHTPPPPPTPAGIRTHNLSRRAATNLRLRPRSHRDRPTRLWKFKPLQLKQRYRKLAVYAEWMACCSRSFKRRQLKSAGALMRCQIEQGDRISYH